MEHPHLRARESFVDVGGTMQPRPAPRFSRTVPDTPIPPQASLNENARDALRGWIDDADIEALMATGVVKRLDDHAPEGGELSV